jgi:ubiquitin thioesterase protein OTUB1
MSELVNDDASEGPMIDVATTVISLTDLYNSDSSAGFVPGIRDMATRFSSIRKVRGDGNCFYRAFLFGYLDNLLSYYLSVKEDSTSDSSAMIETANIERARVLGIVEKSMAELVELGYSEFAIEVFYDEFCELLSTLFEFYNRETLLEAFQEGGKADYYTWFMRLLTASFIKRDWQRFQPFVEGPYYDADAFCKGEVEPMKKECEQIQIIALTEYLGVPIDIAYLDGRPFDEAVGLSSVRFPDSASNSDSTTPFLVHLLYRPGHYDLLYK